MPEPHSSLHPRADVRFRRQGRYLYVCSSKEALRIPFPDNSGAGADGPNVEWWRLPERTLDALLRRGLLVPVSEPLHRHPSYQNTPSGAGPVRVLGDDAVSTGVASGLREAGVVTTSGEDAHIPAQALVLSLAADDADTLRATEAALDRPGPVIVHAHTPAKLYLAVLHPPRTACPTCLVRRLRALWPGKDIADAPLALLLGLCSDSGWPSSSAAIGLVTHHVLRALGTGTENGPEGDDPVTDLIELDLDSWYRERHPVLHLPGCPGCGHRVGRPAQSRPPYDERVPGLEECWRRMRCAVDPLTGIVSGLDERAPEDADVTLAWTVHGSDTSWYSPVRAGNAGGAAKHDPVGARVCALGEAMERYAAGVYDPATFTRAAWDEFGDNAVDPRDYPLGSAAEYASSDLFVPYQPDMVIDWVGGVELGTGARRYVPACTVHVPYRAPRGTERLMNPISTGLAAGSTPGQAVRGGLLEVVERDAFTLFWYNRLTVPTFDLDSLPDGPARAVLDRMALRGIRVIAKDVTTDLDIPTVLLSGRQDTRDGCVVLHASRSGLDFHEALRGAGEELELGFCQISSLLDRRGVPESRDGIRGMWDFYTYYCRPDRAELLGWIADGPVREVPPAAEPIWSSDVDELVRRLVARGHRPVAVDLTPVDVAECGVTVVRSVVPGLQPMAFSLTFRHLGGSRLYQAPVSMGVRGRALTEAELNPDPIPMA